MTRNHSAVNRIAAGGLAASSGAFPRSAAASRSGSAGLLLISVRPVFASWVRVTGILAAVLFIVVAGLIFSGTPLLPTASPLPFFAYPFLVLTFVGWIQALLARESAKSAGASVA